MLQLKCSFGESEMVANPKRRRGRKSVTRMFGLVFCRCARHSKRTYRTQNHACSPGHQDILSSQACKHGYGQIYAACGRSKACLPKEEDQRQALTPPPLHHRDTATRSSPPSVTPGTCLRAERRPSLGEFSSSFVAPQAVR